jgi:N-carbamoylputrescine amidase
VKRYQALAAELNVVLPASFYERAGTAFYNSMAMIDAYGSILGIYRKAHIPESPGYHEKFYFSPGDTGFKVWPTRFGTIGVGICWDQWFPETARVMALLGAEILLYPMAIGAEPQDATIDSRDHWQRAMQGHAASNVMPVIASNRVGTEQGERWTVTYYGSSFIADQTGAILEQAARAGEAVLTATFDLEALHRGVLGEWQRQIEVSGGVILAEVRRLEQFLDQDDVRALAGGLANQPLGSLQVLDPIVGAGELGGGNSDLHGQSLQNVGGVLALMISHTSGPGFWNRCGTPLSK